MVQGGVKNDGIGKTETTKEPQTSFHVPVGPQPLGLHYVYYTSVYHLVVGVNTRTHYTSSFCATGLDGRTLSPSAPALGSPNPTLNVHLCLFARALRRGWGCRGWHLEHAFSGRGGESGTGPRRWGSARLQLVGVAGRFVCIGVIC